MTYIKPNESCPIYTSDDENPKYKLSMKPANKVITITP